MEDAVHPDALTFVVREAMSMLAPCRHCYGGDVAILGTPVDGRFNWNVSIVAGRGSGDCLVALLPLIEELRQRFPIADASRAVGRIDLTRLAFFANNFPIHPRNCP